MKEKLQEYALIAEITGGIAIVISLVFVGFQIQDGNREARAATIQASLDSELLFQTEALRYATIWDKVINQEEVTDPEERRRAIILYNMMMTINENRFEQYNAGYLDSIPPSPSAEWRFHQTWRQSPGALSRSPEFLEYIDGINANRRQ